VLLPQEATTVLPLSYASPGRRGVAWRGLVLLTAGLAATAAMTQRYFFRPAPMPVKCLSPVLFVGPTTRTVLTVNGRTLTTWPTPSLASTQPTAMLGDVGTPPTTVRHE
jgi:hypothetical protein